MKEFFRKFLVGLKRKPQNIALAALVISFVYYSLNLTLISNTTARIQGPGMGIYGFVTMLFSMLAFMCFMVAAVIFSDIMYRNIIVAATTGEGAVVVTEATIYIAKAYTMLGIHVVLLIIFLALLALLPVYSKLIKKIKTSVEVESYGKMKTIEISE